MKILQVLRDGPPTGMTTAEIRQKLDLGRMSWLILNSALGKLAAPRRHKQLVYLFNEEDDGGMNRIKKDTLFQLGEGGEEALGKPWVSDDEAEES